MTAVSAIIQRAFREGNLLPIGQSPTDLEQAEALAALNELRNNALGMDMGQDLSDWFLPAPQLVSPVSSNFPQLPMANNVPGFQQPNPPAQARVIWGRVTGTVYLPYMPQAGSRVGFVLGSGLGDNGSDTAVLTIDGNSRLIAGAATVVLTIPFDPVVYWYRDDLAQWLQWQDALALTDQMDFSVEFDMFWVTTLAIRMATRYNKTILPSLASSNGRASSKFKTRFYQSEDTTYGAQNIPRALESYRTGNYSFLGG